MDCLGHIAELDGVGWRGWARCVVGSRRDSRRDVAVGLRRAGIISLHQCLGHRPLLRITHRPYIAAGDYCYSVEVAMILPTLGLEA